MDGHAVARAGALSHEVEPHGRPHGWGVQGPAWHATSLEVVTVHRRQTVLADVIKKNKKRKKRKPKGWAAYDGHCPQSGSTDSSSEYKEHGTRTARPGWSQRPPSPRGEPSRTGANSDRWPDPRNQYLIPPSPPPHAGFVCRGAGATGGKTSFDR